MFRPDPTMKFGPALCDSVIYNRNPLKEISADSLHWRGSRGWGGADTPLK